MEASRRGRTFRSFLLGSLIGSATGLVAGIRVRGNGRQRPRMTPAGLAAFEEAPCYQETLEREAAATASDPRGRAGR